MKVLKRPQKTLTSSQDKGSGNKNAAPTQQYDIFLVPGEGGARLLEWRGKGTTEASACKIHGLKSRENAWLHSPLSD